MASPVDTSVKFALGTMVGAPIISGTAGSRLAAMRAFLVTGFGLKTVDSASISSGKCRLNFSSGVSVAHVNSVVFVEGGTPAGINGEQKVTAVGNSWVEFATALPDGPVSGSVTFKLAPLGWEEVFSKTNVAVFRPTDVRSSRPYLRVDDTSATVVLLQMFESMSDVDTGLNQSPNRYWPGRSSASASAIPWIMAGDGRGFMFIPMHAGSAVDATNACYSTWFFGDIVSDRSGDAYAALLTGDTTNSASNGYLFSSSTSSPVVMRIAAGIGGATTCEVVSETKSSAVSGADTSMGPFPSRAANALLLTRIAVGDGGTLQASGRRGRIPGAYHCPQSGVLNVLGTPPTQLQGTGAFSGKTFVSFGAGSTLSSAATGVAFVDITGPWRGA